MDLQYLYNPLHVACTHFLSQSFIREYPRIIDLFLCAQCGIKKLLETYHDSAIIVLILNYYSVILSKFIADTALSMETTLVTVPDNSTTTTMYDIPTMDIFVKDGFTGFYTCHVCDTLNMQWTPEKLHILLNLISYLVTNIDDTTCVDTLQTMMVNVDEQTKTHISNLF